MKPNFKTLVAVFAILSIRAAASAQTINEQELKKNQAPVSNALEYINKLEPVTYEFDQAKYKSLGLPAGTQFGFNADDVKRILPGMVKADYKWHTTGKNTTRAVEVNTVDMHALVPILVSAIKEQQTQIQQLKHELELLKSERSE